MSNVRILVHAVWATHNRQKVLTKEIREKLFTHIKDNAKNKDLCIIKIGGHLEHIHCLISMGPQQDISLILQLIKGEASFWVNKEKLLPVKLKWCKEYFAASINLDSMNRVCNYINDQEAHHKNISFQEEYNLFLKKHGFLG